MPKHGDAPDFPEDNAELQQKGLPCEDCGSSDALALYADGHTHCFSCGKTKFPQKGKVPQAPITRVAGSALMPPTRITFQDLKDRGLKATTLRRFGYGLTVEGHHVAPYYAEDGTLACQKLRKPNKEFVVLKAPEAPEIGKCQLFGRPVWGDKNDKRVVVTEGELDAMSCAQATDFKFPCVSVSSGAKGAIKSLRSNFLWLDRFDEIVLWFDNDEPGREALAECAPLFKVGKVKIARITS